jgi:hypothetical protein
MTGHGSKLRYKQDEAIAALLSEPTFDEAAANVGISPRTLRRWQQDPSFAAGLRKARKDAYLQSIARLQEGSSAAVTTLLKVMIDANTPPACKVRAADSVLNHSAKAIEWEDLEARVSELERAAEAAKTDQDEDAKR